LNLKNPGYVKQVKMIKNTQDIKLELSNLEKDNTYSIIEVLKEIPYGRIEKVTKDGNIYIRKCFLKEFDLQNEYKILSQLNYDSLPKIYDYYQLSNSNVMIEEFLPGQSLTDLINFNGKIPYIQALKIALELCDIVQFLHSQNNSIIHRDIKPDNIIYGADGHVKLIDFGAARNYKINQTKDTVYYGTLGYAPPEQFGFGQTDHRTDIFSIGMTMLHMLTGKAPERGDKNILSHDIPKKLRKIIFKATQFDPDKRYHNISSLKIDFKSVLNKKDKKLSPRSLKNISLWLGFALIVLLGTCIIYHSLNSPSSDSLSAYSDSINTELYKQSLDDLTHIFIENGAILEDEKPFYSMIDAQDGIMLYLDDKPVKLFLYKSEAQYDAAFEKYSVLKKMPRKGLIVLDSSYEKAIEIFNEFSQLNLS